VNISKTVIVGVVVALGALFAFGSWLAILFEAQGFGGDRDSGRDVGQMTLLFVALLASIVIPAMVSVWAFPNNRRLVVGAAMAVAVLLLLISGVSLR